MSRPYFKELAGYKPKSNLHTLWIDYALSFDKEDITDMIDNGMLHQARALRSMIREVSSGQLSRGLLKKIDVVVIACRRSSDNLR